ncbi:MAG: hypothetical protein OZSIB_2296 [Candidatus Ozemobacter sibiricus]|jgi:hypothetical protein|uniref:Pathogenicity locus n=1 Tax=Candidatus Ozemobacter sibiricus TaxID=2268124 RepID=A0A367ZUA2_9BACT|nr:MAG: hypothetical protein OZSIB_2296 [Candidatus Ozemobacter sibiricus]
MAMKRQPAYRPEDGGLPSGPLECLPGVGRRLAWDLIDLGVHLIEDLRGADPEMLYRHLNILRGQTQGRCVLYAFRCAVHFASTPHPTRESLKWWNWTDARLGKLAARR